MGARSPWALLSAAGPDVGSALLLFVTLLLMCPPFWGGDPHSDPHVLVSLLVLCVLPAFLGGWVSPASQGVFLLGARGQPACPWMTPDP